MEEHGNLAGNGEDSIDSIPGPEYEAVEAGGAILHSSSAADSLHGNKLDASERGSYVSSRRRRVFSSDDDDLKSENSFSKKSDIILEDFKDTATTTVLLREGSDTEGCKRYKYDSAESNMYEKQPQGKTRAYPITEGDTHKLVEAKTKDNQYLMVHLVDSSGKPIHRPSTQSASSNDKSDPPTTSKTPAKKSGTPTSACGSSRQPCSSPSLMREILALQKSVTESKILTKFVTDTTTEKARKRKIAAAIKDAGPKTDQKSSQEFNRSLDALGVKPLPTTERNQTPQNVDLPLSDPAACSTHRKNEKTRKSGSSRFVPLKDESSHQSDAGSCASAKGRSRSKSVSRKIPDDPEFHSTTFRLKRYPSDENQSKRTNMRSQNSEFVKKQIDFLDHIKRQEDGMQHDGGDNDDAYEATSGKKDHNSNSSTTEMEGAEAAQMSVAADGSVNDSINTFLGNFTGLNSSGETMNSQVLNAVGLTSATTGSWEKYLESIYQPPPKRGWDSFCWKCHECQDLIPCSKCVRSFHPICIKMSAAAKMDKTWTCSECVAVENVLNGPKRTRRSDVALDLLNQLLAFALKRMRNVKGMHDFLLSLKRISDFPKYFANPVTFETLQEKIEKKAFRCAEEFVSETKWMQHNALIAAGGTSSKDTLAAKAILKICRQEANEIDTCPECYLNANTRNDWFVDVCSQPHLLLWAKLKGFPYWPAKAMGPGQGNHVNVRFFGEHDRAFVPTKDCYLFSEQVPNAQTGKRSTRAGFTECIQEVELHIEKIRAKVGAFSYAPYKTSYDPANELQQLELMMPGVQEYMKRQQSPSPQKPPLQYKIVKTADNNLSIIKKGTSADSGTDSDHSLGINAAAGGATITAGSHAKKKSQIHSETTGTDLNRNSKNISKLNYEVISKIDDESNSSKVNSVILKRKSEHVEHRKDGGGANLDPTRPKMTKMEESLDGKQRNRSVIGESKVNEESEKKNESKESSFTTKAQSKPEPKVPVLTIKTSGNKVMDTKADVSKDIEKKDESPNGQNSVKNLVIFKPGVTIKKVTKDDFRKKHAEKQSSEKAAKESVSESVKNSKPVKDKPPHIESSKGKQNQPQAKKPLIDLVPFVEVKKEVSSEDEVAEVNKTTAAAVSATTATPSSTKTSNVVAESAVKDAVSVPPQKATPAVSVTQVSGSNASDVVLPKPVNAVSNSVKQEVLSDEEAVTTSAKPADSDKTPGLAAASVAVSSASTPVTVASSEPVRVVGGTTIQRVGTKNTTTTSSSKPILDNTPQTQPSVVITTTAAPTVTTHSTSVQACATNANLPKRGTVGGIAYSPLPSTVTSVKKGSNSAESGTASNPVEKQPPSQQQQQLQNQPQTQHQKIRPDQQRARKSFPNRSPSGASPIRVGVVTPPTTASTTVITPHVGDPKKTTFTKASMVSIPVDVTTNRSNVSAIPIPPLTAVTKVVPTSCAPPTSEPSCPPAPTPVTTFINCNGATSSMTMSAPPPLAGLSYNTVASIPATTITTSTSGTQILNGGASNNPTDIANNVNVDPLGMSDFVTPAMASTITEVICRGPPRMMPRPGGPLKSDGSTMFPSQAGPVSRTLTENAHKLTDFFISVMEDTMSEMSAEPESVLQAKVTLLALELERTKQMYERQVSELKRTSDLMLSEMRKSMENEKIRIASDVRKQCEQERKRSIEETKKKQWCANCGRESQFHCCWNTSYCDYPCQQLHWSRHAASCAQTRPATSEPVAQSVGASATNQLDRHQISSKSLTTITTNTPSHYSNKSALNNKKDKSAPAKTPASGAVMSSTISTNTTPTEVLKLPTNTYLRPVGSSPSVRTPYPPQAPVQRFNIPLPLPTPTNMGAYTLVQREGNWELMSAAASKANSSVVPTNAQQMVAVSHHHPQQQRLIPTVGTLSTKSPVRSRGGNASSAALQPHGAHLSNSSLQCSGGGSLRSTQM